MRKNLQMMLTLVLLVLAVISLHWQERLFEKASATTPAEEVEPVVYQTEEQKNVACLQQHNKQLLENRTYNTNL